MDDDHMDDHHMDDDHIDDAFMHDDHMDYDVTHDDHMDHHDHIMDLHDHMIETDFDEQNACEAEVHEHHDEDVHQEEMTNNAIISLVFYILVLVSGLPGNAIILQTYAWKKRKTSTDVLIMAQGTIDFIACSFTPAFIIESGVPDLLTSALCRMKFSIEEVTALTSLFLTTLISVERYLAVCHPMRRRVSVRRWIAVLVVFVVLVTVFTGRFASFAVVCSYHEMMVCQQPTSLGYTMSKTVFFIVSFTTTTILYALVYAFLRKRAMIHADLVSGQLSQATVGSNHPRPLVAMISHAAMSSNLHQSGDIGSHENKVERIQIPSSLMTPGCSSQTNSPLPSKKLFGGTKTKPELITTEQSHDSNGPAQLLATNTDSYSTLHPKQQQQHRSLDKDRLAEPKSRKEFDFGRKTTRMLLVMTMYFFLTWLPHIVIIHIPHHVIEEKGEEIQGFFALIGILLTVRLTNHTVNFFVYYLVSNRFRKDVKDSFKVCASRIGGK
ncbi:uncharacterized protein LOC129274412 [Lytechinus pictus]|uniref:uncharacterized protein LOC129274412 n=1 Tax=Lytechinus pictus TaxID=7653 RepID=UPI0030BA099C